MIMNGSTGCSTNNNNNNNDETNNISDNIKNNTIVKIAIIGGSGASGLAASRAIQKFIQTNNINTNNNIVVSSFEKNNQHTIGGVWDYQYQQEQHIEQQYEEQEKQQQMNDNKKNNISYNDNNNNNNKNHPMYRNLRTNLPKELMAYPEYTWSSSSLSSKSNTNSNSKSSTSSSYVSHIDVKNYLYDYATNYNLQSYIQYNCTIQQLTAIVDSDETDTSTIRLIRNDTTISKEQLPKIQLTWTTTNNDSPTIPALAGENSQDDVHEQQQEENTFSEIFDGVIICNGHYSKPSIPNNIDGILTNFTGTIIHSIEYDTPTVFIGHSVLLIGARASGSDIAREIATAAAAATATTPTYVYLSDSTYKETIPTTKYGVTLVPRTKCILSNQHIIFDYDCKLELDIAIDTIILCSGYDYDYPFINNNSSNSNIQLSCTNRCVQPLYKQLWHSYYPNIAFIGIPHSIVPFPLFEYQANAIIYQWLQFLLLPNTNNNNKKQQDQLQLEEGVATCDGVVTKMTHHSDEEEVLLVLPEKEQRILAAEIDSKSGGPEITGRIPQDTHYLGSYQWEYCQTMSKYSNTYTEQSNQYLQTNKAMYDHASESRKGFPAGPDLYRSLMYRRHTANHLTTNETLFSVVSATEEDDDCNKIYKSRRLIQNEQEYISVEIDLDSKHDCSKQQQQQSTPTLDRRK